MSDIELTNLEPAETRLDVPNIDTVITPNKRWRAAVLKISFAQAWIKSYLKYHVIDLDSSRHPFSVEKTRLSVLVRNKDKETLGNLGGVGGVASALQSDMQNGIPGDADDVARRKEAFGSNTLKKPPSKGVFHFLAEYYKNQNTLLDFAFGALALGLDIKVHGPEQGWHHGGGSTFVTVLVCTAVPIFIILRQSKKFHELSQFINGSHIDVVRSGRHQRSSISEIVVGDVIFLEKGQQILADGLFLDGHSLKVDESTITGEIQSEQVNVNSNHNPFLLSGSKVVDGYGKMLVTSVGKNTGGGYCQIMNGIKWRFFEETLLLQWLEMFRPSERRVILVVALLPSFVAARTRFQNGSRVFNGSNKTMLDHVAHVLWEIARDALIIGSVVISYRLPAAMNPTLAYSTEKMMARKAMGRELSAYKRMGNATTICTNKTGTLTLGQMRVTKFWLGQKPMMDPASSSVAINYVLGLVREGVALNTSGCVYKSSMNSGFEFSGSPTEKALLSWAVGELETDTEELTRNCTILHVMAFSSTKKQSGMLLRRADNSIHVHWKGAAEIILNMCSKYYDSSGILKDLDAGSKLQFEEITQGMASSSLQCIAFAHAEVSGDDQGNKQIKEDGLTLLGLVGINDACWPGVKDFVKECQFGGVKVRMITGDNVFIAKAIATKCGILEPNQDGAVIEGKDFRCYTPEERLEKVDKIRVMARSTPNDKVLMVQCLKKKGHKVAVIGARENDAPALIEADIGLSMGNQGTKMAKQHSDIVILDDKFETIATVLRWGRYVYSNIKKADLFQMTANFVLFVIEFVAVKSVGRSQLTTLKLVWINVVVETLSVLALSTEDPPVDRTEPLIIDDTWLNIFIYAFFQIEILLVLLFKGESLFGVTSRVNDTMIFSVFVLCQAIHGSNAVHLDWNLFKSLGKKKKFWGMTGMTLALQLVVVEVLKMISDAERLNLGQWIACIGIAVFGWPIGFVVNLLGLVVVLRSYKYVASFSGKFIIVSDDKPKLQLSNLIKVKDNEALLQFEGVYGVAKYLKTDARKGLDGNHQNITRRQKEFGYNRYHNLSTKSFHQFVIEAIKDPLVWFLMMCALLSLGLNIKENGLKDGWYNGGSILIVLLVVVTICSVSHIWPQTQINILSKMVKELTVEVIRNGKKQHISISNVVVGDIVCLKRGSRVPADGLFLKGRILRLDESSLREESGSVEVKRDQNPFLFYGSKVQSGFGKMLVTSVGGNTKWAEIASLLGNESHECISLKKRLKRLSKVMGLVGSAIAVSLSVVLMIRYFTLHVKNGDVEKKIMKDRTEGDQVWRWVVGIQVSALAVASSAIPEGLPLAIAVTFAYTMNRMMDLGVLPRSFSACETLASATVICLSTEGNKLQTEEVRKAVQDFKKAKVNIKLITRDNVSTAKATASHCGILDTNEELDNEQVMQAFDFRNCTEAERKEKVEKMCVLAEATSYDKLLFVKCLKDKGHVVAVTGQGEGDAHALKGADVGIHIGFQGTDTAVENSDIIVLHGGFVSTVAALQVGRGIYDGIKVFIQFLFTANIVSLASDIVSTVLTDHPPTIDILATVSVSEVPYAVVQMMWVKLIVGTLSALALVVEQKREDVMQKPPTKPGQPLISNEMCINILIHASYEIAILLTLQFKGEAIFNLHNNVKDTLIFNIFVLFRVFALLTPWKSDGNIFSGIQRRKLYWGIVCAIVIVQIVIVETLPRVMATKTLNVWQWVACIGIAFTSWLVGYIGSKYIPVPKESFLIYLSKLWKHQLLLSLFIVYCSPKLISAIQQ